jgi:hypothetical protein
MKPEIEIIRKFVDCLNKSIPYDLKITPVNEQDKGDADFAVFFDDRDNMNEDLYMNKNYAENWGYISKTGAGTWDFSYRVIYPERRYDDGTGEPENIEFIDVTSERCLDIVGCIAAILKFRVMQHFHNIYESFVMEGGY